MISTCGDVACGASSVTLKARAATLVGSGPADDDLLELSGNIRSLILCYLYITYNLVSMEIESWTLISATVAAAGAIPHISKILIGKKGQEKSV